MSYGNKVSPHTRRGDAWALIHYIREGTVHDRERVIVLIRMINDYFSVYKSRDADMVLRHLVVEALSYITHPTHPQAIDNNIVLELAVEGTSRDFDVILPSIYDPKSIKVDQTSSHESIYGPLPCEPISGSPPNVVVHNDPNSWGATATGENRQASGKEETKNYAEASDPKEHAPIETPNHNGETIGAEDIHGHPTSNVKEERTSSAPYVRCVTLEDIQVWKSQPSARLYSRSDTDRLAGMARNEWVAIALRALLTDRVSKYVKNAVSSYAIKDWQWIARLVERLAHRGLIWYGIEVGVVPIMDCGNDLARVIYNLSLYDHMDSDSNSIHDPIMSSWGRSSATYLTRRSLEMNHSSSHSIRTIVMYALGREYTKSPTE